MAGRRMPRPAPGPVVATDRGEGPIGRIVALAVAGSLAVGLVGFAPSTVRDLGDRVTCRVGSLLGGGACAATLADAGGESGGSAGTNLALLPGRERQVAPPGTRFPQNPPAQPPGGTPGELPHAAPGGLVPLGGGFPGSAAELWPEGAIRNEDGSTTIVIDDIPVVVDSQTSQAIDSLASWDPLGLADPSTLSGSVEEGQEFSLNPDRAPVRYGNRVPGSFVEGDDGWRLNTDLTGWMSDFEFVEAIQSPEGRRAILRHLADLVVQHDGDLGRALEEFAGDFGTAEELIRDNAEELVSLLTRNVEGSVESGDTPDEWQRLLEEYTRDDVWGTGGLLADGSGGDDPPDGTRRTGTDPEDDDPEDDNPDGDDQDDVPEGFSSREEYVQHVVDELERASDTSGPNGTPGVVDIEGLRPSEVSRHLLEIRRAVARGARLDAHYDQMTAINQGNANILFGWHGRAVPVLLGASILGAAGTTATVAYFQNQEANRRHAESEANADERSEQARVLQNQLHEASETAAERRHNESQIAATERHLAALEQSQDQFAQSQAEAQLRALEAERLTLQQDSVNNFVSLRDQWNSRFRDRPANTVPLLTINGFQFSVLDERLGRTMTPTEMVDRIRNEVPDALSVPVDAAGDPLPAGARPLTQAEAEQLVREYYESVPGLDPPQEGP